MSRKDALGLLATIVTTIVSHSQDRRRIANPRYISDELHHLVGSKHPHDDEANYALLKVILRSGWVSCAPPERGPHDPSYSTNFAGSLADESFIRGRITCFCDIPLESLALHTGKYGRFGMSFSRWHMAHRGARPVSYIPLRQDDWAGAHSGGTILKNLEASYRGLLDQLCSQLPPAPTSMGVTTAPRTPEEAAEKVRRALAMHVLAFIKPFNSHLSELDPAYYYSEREWRVLGSVEANPETVTRIIVARGFLRRARRELPQYADRIVFAPKRP